MVWQGKLMEKMGKTRVFIIDWVINPLRDHSSTQYTSMAQVVAAEEASQMIGC